MRVPTCRTEVLTEAAQLLLLRSLHRKCLATLKPLCSRLSQQPHTHDQGTSCCQKPAEHMKRQAMPPACSLSAPQASLLCQQPCRLQPRSQSAMQIMFSLQQKARGSWLVRPMVLLTLNHGRNTQWSAG